MRTPGHDFELAAGWLVHEGLVAAARDPRRRLLHRRRPGARAGVQRRHGDPRPAADPGPRPPARRLRLVGLRGLRQGQRSPRRSPRPRRAGGPAPLPAADVVRTAAGPAARAASRSSTHRRRARGRPGHRRRRAARRPRGRRPAQRRRQGDRRAGRWPAVARRGVPGGQRPGRVRAGAEGGRRRRRLAGRRRRAHQPRRCGWPRRPGSSLYGFTSPRAGACGTPDQASRRGRPVLSALPPSVRRHAHPPHLRLAPRAVLPPRGHARRTRRRTSTTCSRSSSAERVDLVVVAGDIYDRALPQVDAVRLADETLARLAASRGAGGAHQRQPRLRAAARVQLAADRRRRGLHPHRRRHASARPVLLERRARRRSPSTASPTSTPTPSASPGRCRPAPTRPRSTEAMRRVRADLAAPRRHPVGRARPRLRRRRPAQRLRARHQRRRRLAWCRPASSTASTTPRSATCTGAHTLTDRVRYSGSPLAYSFSEADQRKGSWLVDLGADGLAGRRVRRGAGAAAAGPAARHARRAARRPAPRPHTRTPGCRRR